MTRQSIAVLGFVLALASAGTATAEEERQPGKVNLFLRGGAGNYTGDLGDNVNVGPTWGLTLDLQPLRFLGFELGYEGARNTAKTALLDISLTRHGASGLVKLSLPLFESVRPFVGIGLGISNITIGGDLRGAFESDVVEEVPLALGVEFISGALTAGARATYRLLLDENLGEQVDNPQGGFFDVALTLGARF
ncbi:outer membrane beta-barrel protein [Hyalangium sp.]|uniref:outer membrane beta-barrel protein n=1 Tax=Hyalangium sp. TaxID=2028555 RepID=UPI002D4C63BF|nr:outer membrane beta-barrel protein [Hyalangium sp.]HYH99495.1 outer membrane beta-barrel protein [Hyalangium sp.]